MMSENFFCATRANGYWFEAKVRNERRAARARARCRLLFFFSNWGENRCDGRKTNAKPLCQRRCTCVTLLFSQELIIIYWFASNQRVVFCVFVNTRQGTFSFIYVCSVSFFHSFFTSSHPTRTVKHFVFFISSMTVAFRTLCRSAFDLSSVMKRFLFLLFFLFLFLTASILYRVTVGVDFLKCAYLIHSFISIIKMEKK